MEWYGINLQWAYSELLSRIVRQTLCKQRAQDILHDALISFALAKNPDRQQQPHAYLQVIVRHQLVNAYHERKRFVSLHADVESDTEQATLLQGDAYISPSTEHIVEIRQRLEATVRLIENLSPRCRKAFWLFRVDGLKQDEIANQLGVSINMVQRYVSRAMVELAEAQELMRR